MTAFTAHIAEQIWDSKYRFKEFDGTPIDLTIEDTWRRIAKALAEAEKPEAREYWHHEFYKALEDFKFIPAGRIVAGAGTGRSVTLSNCFTMGTIPDSMNGIFEALKEAALTMQQGGGIGYDFSTLRPKGALVKGVGSDASGPLSFMDCWDSMCRTIMSAGSRRGAMMGTMRVDHPDIEDFITAKQDKTRLRNFNLSVLVTDSFMEALKSDGDFHLWFNGKVYRTVRARDLWDKIMQSTYAYAEPGVIFIDRMNADHNIGYLETIATTNPCGEKGMGPYASCLLGSINLTRFVLRPFTASAIIDEDAIRATVETAIRMMDNVVDVGGFPLESQRQKAKEDRQLGLGVTGLADMLLMLGVTYGSDKAVKITDEIMHLITLSAYSTSVDLAREKGPFPTFNADEFLKAPRFASRMGVGMVAAIRKYGIRNALLTSIAPTGTISLMAGNVSSGIEPVFAYHYTRKVLEKDGSRREEAVEDYAYALWRKHHAGDEFGNETLPDYFVSAQTLAPEAHVRMQAAAQKWVDSSISKTINCPEDISFEAFKDVYMQAYDMGCKGCTTYRPNDVTGSVLSVEPAKPKEMTIDELRRIMNGWLSVPDEVTKTSRMSALRKWLDDKKVDKVTNLPKSAWAELLEWTSQQPAADFSAALDATPEPAPVLDTAAFDFPTLATSEPTPRSEALHGSTYKLKWPGSDHALYVTINDTAEGQPYEIFFNSKDTEHFQWTMALSRMISAVFRRGGDVRFVHEELKQVFDPRGGAWIGGKYIPSILGAIGGIIEKHMSAKRQTFYVGGVVKGDPHPPLFGEYAQAAERPVGKPCPKCGSFHTKNESGCFQCLDCGNSKCG